MASTTYSAKFFWPDVHPHSVIVTGSFDNWSGNAHHLQKSETGFEAIVELEYNKTYEFKYVVDGNWQAREDQDKEWDSQGNMNNVYRTPEAPVMKEEPAHTPVVAPNAVDSSAVDQSNRELGTGHRIVPSQKPTSITSAQSVGDAELTNSAPLHADEQVIPETTAMSSFTEAGITPAQQIAQSTFSDETSDIATSTSTVGSTSPLDASVTAPSGRVSDKETIIVPTPAQALAYSASDTMFDPSTVTGIRALPASGSSAVQETTPKLEQKELLSTEYASYPPGLGEIMGEAKSTSLIVEKSSESEIKAVEHVDDHKLAGVSGYSEADTDYSMLDDNLSSTASEQNFEHIASPRIEEEPLVVVPHPTKTTSSASVVPASIGNQTVTQTSEDLTRESSTSAGDLDVLSRDEDNLPSHAKTAAEAINSANAAHPSAEDPTSVPSNIPERNPDEVLVPAGSGDPRAMEPSTVLLEKQEKDKKGQDEKKQDIGANSSNAAWNKAPTTSSATTPINTDSSSHQHDPKKSTHDMDLNKDSSSTQVSAATGATPNVAPIPVVISSGPSPTLKSTGLPTSASGTLSIPETQNIHATSQPTTTTSELSTSTSHLRSPKPMDRSISAASSIRDVPGQYPSAGSGFTTQSVESTPASSPAKPQRTASERDEAVKKRKSGLFGRIGKLFGSK